MSHTQHSIGGASSRSISHDEIARCKRTDANLAALRELCESSVEADEEEFWGEDDNGNEWRVHVPAAA